MWKLQVDVQLLRPNEIDKQQPYWSWGDETDDSAEMVQLWRDDAEEKTTTAASVEEKDEDIDSAATLPSSSKASITYFPIFTS